MEFLAANDQENIVHGFHAGAAGKQGAKAFGSKTPANKAPKTPFKVPLNDENAPFRAGKSVLKTNGKGNQDLLTGGKKGGDLDKNAFVTPAGPRNRAPLGMKTTNAKTKAFQTPAPLTASAKTQKKTSPRLRRPKVKVHQAEPLKDEAQEEEREIEYMPPRGIPLPDEPEDWPSDMKYPMFEGKNMTRGITQTYFNPIGDDGLSLYEREDMIAEAKGKRELDETLTKAMEESMAQVEREAFEGLGLRPKKTLAKCGPAKKDTAPSTLKSRSAAVTLSPASKPSYAAPTAATKSKAPSNLMSSKKTKVTAPINSSAARHATATTASRSTLGYSQGRAASTSLRKPLSNLTKNSAPSTKSDRLTSSASIKTTTQVHKPTTSQPVASCPTSTASSRGSFSRSSSGATLAPSLYSKEDLTYEAEEDLIREIRLRQLQNDDDDEEVDSWMNSFAGAQPGLDFEDEYDDFQLTVPEGL